MGYTVHESGIYVFTWTIYGFSRTTATTELMINSLVAKTLADSQEINDIHTSTGITVANVNMGDHVYVKFSATYLKGRLETSYGHSTFSGWKLD